MRGVTWLRPTALACIYNRSKGTRAGARASYTIYAYRRGSRLERRATRARIAGVLGGDAAAEIW